MGTSTRNIYGNAPNGKAYGSSAGDRQVEEVVECLLRQMMERQGVDEVLKASDQMAWVHKVNALRVMAEEVVLREIVY